MKPALFAVVALCLSHGGVIGAGKPPVTLFSKADPALRLVERSDSYEKGSFAKWLGRLTLSGRLVVEFDRAPPGEKEPDTAGIVAFEPDLKSRARLPAAQNYYSLPVNAVWLERTPLEVLPSLVGKERALNIIRGKKSRYELPVFVDVTAFRTSVECDQRSYSMEYSSIRLAGSDIFAALEAKNLGC